MAVKWNHTHSMAIIKNRMVCWPCGLTEEQIATTAPMSDRANNMNENESGTDGTQRATREIREPTRVLPVGER